MEKRFILLVTFLSVVMIAMAQPVSDSDTSGSVRSEYCVRGAQYPRITPDHRAQFKVVAPEAKLVQIDLGKKYDLIRNEKGEWLGTTEPLGPGFHYYFLIVDGVRVADPSSESFYGCSMHTSGIEIPYAKDVLQYELADVPHGEVRMKRYLKRPMPGDACLFILLPATKRAKRNIRCCIFNTVAVKMKEDGSCKAVPISFSTTLLLNRKQFLWSL